MIKFAPNATEIGERYELPMVKECETCGVREETTLVVTNAEYARNLNDSEGAHFWITCDVCNVANTLHSIRMELVRSLNRPADIAGTLANKLLKFYSEELDAYADSRGMDSETLRIALILVRDGWNGYFESALETAEALNS